MESSRPQPFTFKTLTKIILPLITFCIISIHGESRDLRPSEHGLAHQASPATATANSSAAMTSFFAQSAFSLSSPVARNSTGPSSAAPEDWWPPTKRSREEKNRLAALKLAAIVCSGAGVGLLVAAGVLFALRFHRRRSGDASLSGNRNPKDRINANVGTSE